jgi:general secretion pathway protein E
MDDAVVASEFKIDSLETLVEAEGLLAPETLARARLIRAETNERLDAIITRLGLVSDDALARSLSRATGAPIADADDYPAAPVAADKVSPRFLRQHRALPLQISPAGVLVALTDPFDTYVLRALTMALRAPILPRVARGGDLDAALDRLFGQGDGPEGFAAEAQADDLERVRDLASDAPAIRALNRLIARAVDERASDIHLEPSEDALEVRYRIDGRLVARESFPAALRDPVVARLKVLAGLNIAERRLPQDGRMRLAVRGHDVDLRVATSPTVNGEGAVLRLLDRTGLVLNFEGLGFDAAEEARFKACLARPHGIILATGPTGSGKTTTLYAALSMLNRPERKILTVEDPIEYRLDGINQTQVSPAIGLTFATALRAFLRQDPDIVMVGEVRDLETAQVAVQAALTGHLILSTLHTNSAATTMTRLLDMGVEPFLITSTLTAVISQRLAPRLCQHCREPVVLESDLARPGAKSPALAAGSIVYRGVGCEACGGAGRRGRLALVELLVMDDTLGRLVRARADASELEAAASAGGMRTLFEDGAAKAALGLVAVEDVLAVAVERDD